MIDVVGLHLLDKSAHTRGIGKVAQLNGEVLETPHVPPHGYTGNTGDGVPLLQKVLREPRPDEAPDAGDEGDSHRLTAPAEYD